MAPLPMAFDTGVCLPKMPHHTWVADNPVTKFFRDGRRLLNRCTKPERREFTKLSKVTAFGVLAVGTMGVVTKLVFGTLLRGGKQVLYPG